MFDEVLAEFVTLDLSKDQLERYEFLGDAILNFNIAAHLFNLIEEAPVGLLSQSRAAIVNNKNLDDIVCQNIEIKRIAEYYVFAGQDTFEALIGYLYVTRPFNLVAEFINYYLGDFLATINLQSTSYKHPKNEIQEWVFARKGNFRFLHAIDSITLFVNIAGVAYKQTLAYSMGVDKKQDLETELSNLMLEQLRNSDNNHLTNEK